VWHVNNCILLLLFYLGKNIAKLATCNKLRRRRLESPNAVNARHSPDPSPPTALPLRSSNLKRIAHPPGQSCNAYIKSDISLTETQAELVAFH